MTIKADKLPVALKPEEGLLYQIITMHILFIEINRHNFLDSEFYKNIDFGPNKEIVEYVLKKSTLGNPASIQSLIYSTVIIPREILGKYNKALLQNFEQKLNNEIMQRVDNIITSYTDEDKNNPSSVDYCRHIRNAVAHSKCEYKSIGDKNYVIFTDDNKHTLEHCEIIIEVYKIEDSINNSLITISEYLNSVRRNRQIDILTRVNNKTCYKLNDGENYDWDKMLKESLKEQYKEINNIK